MSYEGVKETKDNGLRSDILTDKQKKSVQKNKAGRPKGRKNGQWKPTENHWRFLRAKLDPKVPNNITAICEHIGINRRTYYSWTEKEGFNLWLQQEWTKVMQTEAVQMLDRIGLDKATEDFRFWEAMQKKYGGYDDPSLGAQRPVNFINITNYEEYTDFQGTLDSSSDEELHRIAEAQSENPGSSE